MTRMISLVATAAALAALGRAQETLIFEENFTSFNLSLWKHELTLNGDMNWSFEQYGNNRSVSFVRNGSLVIRPTLTNFTLGNAGLTSADVNIWGGDPASASARAARAGRRAGARRKARRLLTPTHSHTPLLLALCATAQPTAPATPTMAASARAARAATL